MATRMGALLTFASLLLSVSATAIAALPAAAVPSGVRDPSPSSGLTIERPPVSGRFSARMVTAKVPTKAVFNTSTRKTVVTKSRQIQVKARSLDGVRVQVWRPKAKKWVTVPYTYQNRTRTLTYNEQHRLNLGMIRKDPLGGVEPRYVVPNSAASNGGGTKPYDPNGSSHVKNPPLENPNTTEADAITTINGVRARSGEPILRTCDNLNAAADSWSRMMADNGVPGTTVGDGASMMTITWHLRTTSGYYDDDQFHRPYIMYMFSRTGESPLRDYTNAQISTSGYNHLGVGSHVMANGYTAWTIIYGDDGRCVNR